MKRRLINTKFWSDNFIVEIEPLQRYLFLYLLTNEHTEICGVYELPIRVIERETGLDNNTILDFFKTYKDKIRYIDGWVFIKNFTKNQCANKSMEIGAERSLQEVPLEIMAKYKEKNTHSDTLLDPPTPSDTVGTPSEILKLKLKLKPKPKLKPKYISCASKMHDTDFDLFWSAYPNKKSKQKAMDIFKKIDKDKLEIILKSVEDYKKTEQWQNPKYIPHPTTFLNQARWEDEIEKVAPQDEEAKYAKELYEKYGDNAIHYFTKYPLKNALKYKFLLNF